MRPVSTANDHNLRHRFRARLTSRCVEGEISHARHDRELINDELLYQLLRDAIFSAARDEPTFRQIYNNERTSTPSAPPFDDLIGQGWFRIAWGRVRSDYNQRFRLKELNDPHLAPLLRSLDGRGPTPPLVPSSSMTDPELQAIDAKSAPGSLRLNQLSALRPAWIAARLWEDANKGTPSSDLRWWNDRWEVLDCPPLLIHRDWTARDADRFRTAALEVLDDTASDMDWAAYRKDLIARIDAGRANRTDSEERVRPLPDGFFARSEWLSDDAFTEDYLLDNPVNGLVRLLLDEAAEDPYSQEGRRAARSVLDLARRSPEILKSAKWHLSRRPVLIAEAVCEPTWTPLACALIADQMTEQEHRRGFVDEHEQAGLEDLLGEAIDVMLARLVDKTLPAGEVADLLAAMRRPLRPMSDPSETPRRYEILHAKVVEAPKSALGDIAAHLLKTAEPGDLDDHSFSALLELQACVDLLDHLDSKAVIDFYVNALNRLDLIPRGQRMSPSACGALYEVSQAAGRAVQNAFFRPLDVAKAMAGRPQQRSEIFHENNIGTALRAHIRVLARAIAFVPKVDDRLLEAFRDALTSGARSDPVTGTVAAFAPRYEHGPSTRGDEPPLADDLVAAILRLNPAQKQKVFAALKATDEPFVLAQLAARLVGGDQATLRQMAEQIPPSAASKSYWPAEDQVRAEALLDARLPDLAEQFDKHSQNNLSAIGQKRQRLARFRNEVRIAYERGDTQALSDLQTPTDLAPFQEEEARFTLDFYQALFDLNRQDGGDAAAAKFESLLARRPHSRALKINLHAAQATKLVRGNVFQLLSPDKIEMATTLIARGKALLANEAVDDQSAVASNNAMLQLAAGDPRGAIASIEPITISARSPEATAYLAVGIARTGNVAGGLEVLRNSPWSAGDRTGMIAAAEAQIKDHAAFSAQPQFVTETDRAQDIKAALADLRNLEPLHQARVHSYADLSGLVRHHVLQSTSALAGMAPALGELATKLHEDSFSFVLRQILIGRVHGLGWSVGDQSKAGYSGAGNAGERDLDLRKETMDLSIVEAVIWRQNDQVLLTHFQKLFGYGSSSVFVYLAYVLEGSMKTLLGKLETIAKDDAPPGFKYQGHDVVAVQGSEPINFTARYAAERGPVEVHFFLVDLSQSVMRTAAQTAAHSAKPRNPRPKKN